MYELYKFVGKSALNELEQFLCEMKRINIIHIDTTDKELIILIIQTIL
jgi:hypothetical protein